ncbi:hypothetical protein TRVA0_047S00584 [Trichomonascus vanleenenianus]|uniref:protein kinase ALK1 n=1 Tax=Trichomonascus vanleenenianus TaxID=2268995 RepID=UPI003ECA6E3A
MEKSHRRSSSSFFSTTGSTIKGHRPSFSISSTYENKTYGKRNKKGHKSALTQSYIDDQLWSYSGERESEEAPRSASGSRQPLVGLGVLDFESNKENEATNWELETTQILNQVVDPNAKKERLVKKEEWFEPEEEEEEEEDEEEEEEEPPKRSIENSDSSAIIPAIHHSDSANTIATLQAPSPNLANGSKCIHPSKSSTSIRSNNSTLSTRALSRIAQARISTVSTASSISSKATIEGGSKKYKHTSISSTSSMVQRSNTLRPTQPRKNIKNNDYFNDDTNEDKDTTIQSNNRSTIIQIKESDDNDSLWGDDDDDDGGQSDGEEIEFNRNLHHLSLSKGTSRTTTRKKKPMAPCLSVVINDEDFEGYEVDDQTSDHYDRKKNTTSASVRSNLTVDTSLSSHDLDPPRRLSSAGSVQPPTPTSTSSLRSKDSRYELASSPSVASFLSFKKSGSEIKHKRVDKYAISGPTGLVETSDYFEPGSGRDNASIASDAQSQYQAQRNRKRRSGHTIFSSISSASLFSNHNKQASTSSSGILSLGNKKEQQSYDLPSPKENKNMKKSSFADIKRSFLSFSPSRPSLFRNSSGSSSKSKSSKYEKPVISLPTPSDTSREKLQNKLRASNSLLSLARSDTSNSLVAVPVREHERYQLDVLLGLCNSSTICDFDSYARSISPGLSKLAEASFSEVYIQNNRETFTSKIYKVIPFGNEELEQLPAQDIIQELTVARLLMTLDGFVDVIDAAVVKGTYPQELLDLWDDYADANGSESHRPDYFQDSQLYCVMVFNNAGTDLEHFPLTTWLEAQVIFWQTVRCLAVAEEKYRFEHRDLHWGNLVISTNKHGTERDRDVAQLMHKLDIQDPELEEYNYDHTDLKVTLIDYTLSRATNMDGTVVYTRMDHPDFFRGKGDYQFDIYRFMRKHISTMQVAPHSPHLMSGSSPKSSDTLSIRSLSMSSGNECDWSVFCAKTNVLWLHYLADKMMNHKGLKKVTVTRSGRLSDASLRDKYKNGGGSVDMGEEAQAFKNIELIHQAIDPRKKRFNNGSGSSGKKHAREMSFQDFYSAQHVWLWGLKLKIVPQEAVN